MQGERSSDEKNRIIFQQGVMDIDALRTTKIGPVGAPAGDASLRALAAKYLGPTHGLFVGVHGSKKGADADPADLAKLLEAMTGEIDDLASLLSTVMTIRDDDLRAMRVGALDAPAGTESLRALAKLHLGESHGLFIGVNGNKRGAQAAAADLAALKHALLRLDGRASHAPAAAAAKPAVAARVIPAAAAACAAIAGGPSTPRVALCIGLGAYHREKKLPNAVRDASDMATVLGEIGFHVTFKENLTGIRATA